MLITNNQLDIHKMLTKKKEAVPILGAASLIKLLELSLDNPFDLQKVLAFEFNQINAAF
jgi:hypothetical protein